MKSLAASLTYLYSRLLRFYPRRFRDEFAAEMLEVFDDSMNEAARVGILSVTLIVIRELAGLPLNILREFWHEFERREASMHHNESIDLRPNTSTQTAQGEAILAILPFVLFAVISMLGKLSLPLHRAYTELPFYAVALLGVWVGLIRGCPRWMYSYLGWSLVFAWWWTSVPTTGFKIFGYTVQDPFWGWRSWYPIFVTIGIALVWTRSLRPLRSMFLGIWQDWTQLSLGLYALSGMVFLLFDENHSPYLFAFMLATTLVITASVWVYMKSASIGRRFMVLFSGFVISYVLIRICDATWDWAAYHGFPPAPPEPWYMEISRAIVMTAVWSAIMFWPALIGFVRSIIDNRQTPRLAS